ncbi:MAG TPA: M48 family metallopeptidase [Chitinophagales bacterium]|nr:M48 family metallopeptidase [Chitinophagales bacterium]
MPAYEGRYFDGQSARPHSVSVTISNRRLSLSSDGAFRREVFQHEITGTEIVGSDRMLIRFGAEGAELLDVRSSEFVKQFRLQFPYVKHSQNVLERIANASGKGMVAILMVLVASVLLIYFFVIPWVGDVSARFFPQQYEEELGSMMYRNIIPQYTIDTVKTNLVNELVENIDFQSPYRLQFVVVDYDQKNAFAMPGGYIVIYSGIMDDMEDYSDLLGLLGHEVSHINKKHTLRSLFRSLSSYIFISILLNDVNGVTTVVLENANSLKTLSFSRKLEQEADLEGLKIMFHNRVDPYGMVRLFENLMKDSDLPDAMEFMSTHPVTEKRISYLKEKISETEYEVEPHENMKLIWEKLKQQN